MGNIISVVASYMEDFNATNTVCVALGTTFNASNLFIGFEQDTTRDSVTIIPYGGAPPDSDRYKQNPYIQLRVKTSTKYKSINLCQELINYMHMNTLDGEGLMRCVNSAPILLPPLDGDQWNVSVSNYDVKHVKK